MGFDSRVSYPGSLQIPCRPQKNHCSSYVCMYVWPWLFERGFILPIPFIPKCLSNKVLMQPTVSLILEIISLDVFPLVGSGMIPVLHISRGIFSPVDYARSQSVSSSVILLYFRNVEDFVTVPHSQSWFVFKVIMSPVIS